MICGRLNTREFVCGTMPCATRWRVQTAEKVRHIKGRLLNQAVILFDCPFFKWERIQFLIVWNHFYHIRWPPLNVTIFITHARNCVMGACKLSRHWSVMHYQVTLSSSSRKPVLRQPINITMEVHVNCKISPIRYVSLVCIKIWKKKHYPS